MKDLIPHLNYQTNGKKYIAVQGESEKYQGCSTCCLQQNGCLEEVCSLPSAAFYKEDVTFEEASMLLPTDAQERKHIPIVTGVLDYFPLAIAEIAKCSKAGNNQHHPNEPLFWDRTKSTDHADCIGRHLIDRGKFDTDGQRHSAKLAWRALAMLQIELENEKKGNT